MNNLLHYNAVSEFKKQFFKDLLGIEHLVSGQIKLDRISYPDGTEEDKYNFWGYTLEKDGIKYLLHLKGPDGREIVLRDTLPIRVVTAQKLAYQSNAFERILDYNVTRFRPKRDMSLRQFVDTLSGLSHSNPEHQKLCWFMALSQMWFRANYRISTPPGFGKDSVVDTLGALIGRAYTTENPTLAKLEFLTNYKFITINEVVDLSKENWRIIEQFLLAAGAHKPAITKHSRATAKGVQEILDISHLSLSIAYNDIDAYPNPKDYVDNVTKKAVLDRFPAFRLYGTFTEDFNAISGVNVPKLVEDNMDWYRKLVQTFAYYDVEKNFLAEFHGYKINGLRPMLSRWRTNIGVLLKVIDVYCTSQEEFDKWVGVINDSLFDYEEMLQYPLLLEKIGKRLDEKGMTKLHDRLYTLPTFIERNKVIRDILEGRNTYTAASETPFWGGT